MRGGVARSRRPVRSLRRRSRFAAAWLAPVVAAVAFAGSALTAPLVSADVVDCDVFASFPNVKISSARNMTCRAAARDMRSYRGNVDRRFRTPGGFTCVRVSGGRLGGQWRCVRRAAAYRFEFGD
jgi:hypothetical protein